MGAYGLGLVTTEARVDALDANSKNALIVPLVRFWYLHSSSSADALPHK